jgi:hypothetical protein
MAKVLSVKQPWASLFLPPDWIYELEGEGKLVLPEEAKLPKDIENRVWDTPYRGPLVIHSSKEVDLNSGLVIPRLPELPRGTFLGIVTLRDIHVFEMVNTRADSSKTFPFSSRQGRIARRSSSSSAGVNQTGPVSPWHMEGMIGWHLTDGRPFNNPVPYKGRLGLWECFIQNLSELTSSNCCGRCGIVLSDHEYCWYCHHHLCSPCWDKFGHCGHPEADQANERARKSA